MKCFECDKPATLVNHTQFAGTHYWCDEHVPPDDKDECTPIEPAKEVNSLILNPANIKIKFTDSGGGFTQRPTSYTCEVYYHDENGHYRATAEGRSAHRAKMDAFNDLEDMVKLRAALEQAEQEAKFHPGQTTVDLDSFKESNADDFEDFIALVTKEWLNSHKTLDNYRKGYNQAIKDTIAYLSKQLQG